MAYMYPYGDSQQLNLSWFLAKFKELYEYVMQLDPGGTGADITTILSRFTEQYDSNRTYIPGDYTIYNGYIYKANTTTGGDFDLSAWVAALPVDDVQGLSTDMTELEQNAVTNTQYTPGADTADGLLRQTKNGTAETVMTVDKEPTENSQNPVKSGAVFSKLEELKGSLNSLPLTDGKKYKICCGILRNSGNGWNVINDAGHTPLNVSNVSVNSNGDIEIAYNFTSHRIKTFICSPDETFAQTYRFGASVGDTSAKISIIKLSEIIGGMTQYNAANQLWTDTFLNGIHYESAGSGIVQMRLNDGRSIVPFPYEASEIFGLSVECRYSIGMINSIGDTGIQFKCFDATTGQLIPTNQWQDGERAFISWNLPSKKVNANNVISQYGNIWFFGLFEVE